MELKTPLEYSCPRKQKKEKDMMGILGKYMTEILNLKRIFSNYLQITLVRFSKFQYTWRLLVDVKL